MEFSGGGRRAFVVAACVGVLAFIVGPGVRASSPANPHGLCGLEDHPEKGVQGDVATVQQEEDAAGVSPAEIGYNCGLALVGHTNLTADGRAPRGNANMAWAGHCAYVAGDAQAFGPPEYVDANGVAVVDVGDPRAPEHVRTLKGTHATTSTLETIYATEAPGRSLLTVGVYGNDQTHQPHDIDIYDVRKCADPVKLTTYTVPDNIHNLTISGNGRYLYTTQPLQVIDLDPLFDGEPETGLVARNLDNVLPYPLVSVEPGPDVDDGLPQEVREARTAERGYTAHEAWPTFDGTKLYLGSQTPTFDVFTIVDIADWLQDETKPPKIISQRSGRGHSIRTARINGVPYVLHSEESVFGGAYGCIPERGNPFVGPAEPWLSNFGDESDPIMRVSQFHLEINQPEHCADQMASGVQASAHYHDVDDPEDTTFAILSMQNAGIRVVDVRDPVRPTEVAYFNPGDVDEGADVLLDNAWAHSRYVPETGQIWVATASGGFWVLELEKQVADHLELGFTKNKHYVHPTGWPGRTGTVMPVDPVPSSQTAAAYCTLGEAA